MLLSKKFIMNSNDSVNTENKIQLEWLQEQAIKPQGNIYWNLTSTELIEHSIKIMKVACQKKEH